MLKNIRLQYRHLLVAQQDQVGQVNQLSPKQRPNMIIELELNELFTRENNHLFINILFWPSNFVRAKLEYNITETKLQKSSWIMTVSYRRSEVIHFCTKSSLL